MGFGEIPAFGGVEDYSDNNAPKSIVSKTIDNFYLSHVYMANAVGGNYDTYVFSLIRKDSYCLYHCEHSGEETRDLILPLSVLDELQNIIDENKIVLLNGYNRRGSALSVRILLRVNYASTEYISIYSEGTTYPIGLPFPLFYDFLIKVALNGEKVKDLSEVYIKCPHCNENNYISEQWCRKCGNDLK